MTVQELKENVDACYQSIKRELYGEKVMRFHEFGERSKPVIIMLTGSFCPAKALEYLYKPLSEDHYVIVPDYNGHYKGRSAFTTRQNEAAEILEFVKSRQIFSIALLYGQSMGSEIGIELLHQMLKAGINVGHAMFDGAPCIRLSVPYKAFMYFKFSSMIRMMRNKSVDEVIGWKFLNKFTGGDNESVRPMLEALCSIAPFVTSETIRNENECCYTFDFPEIPESMQTRMHFLYGSSEKAYKTCHTLVRKSYPHAKMTVFRGFGHMTYSARHTKKYLRLMREEISVEK